LREGASIISTAQRGRVEAAAPQPFQVEGLQGFIASTRISKIEGWQVKTDCRFIENGRNEVIFSLRSLRHEPQRVSKYLRPIVRLSDPSPT
jgi:hypothetical protein